MARKVTDSSNSVPNPLYNVSQTPGNYDAHNYYDHYLQTKIDYDWRFRPNRVNIEYQPDRNDPNTWLQHEMVVQHIKTDTGDAIANDYRRLVFRNLRETMPIGTKWRFSPEYDMEADEIDKDVWIVFNKDEVNLTSSLSVVRCNGNIGSVYIAENGEKKYHYEPLVFPRELKNSSFFYNQVAVSPQNQLVALAQFNKYTNSYYYNQRFIIGPVVSKTDIYKNKIYRLIGFDKFYGNSTYKENDTGIMLLYFEITEASEYDNFDTRIAYNQESTNIPVIDDDGDYAIKLIRPIPLPTSIDNSETHFEFDLFHGNVRQNKFINVLCTLPGTTVPENYYSFQQIQDNRFKLKRLKPYYKGKLHVKCYITADQSPTEKEFSFEFDLGLDVME